MLISLYFASLGSNDTLALYEDYKNWEDLPSLIERADTSSLLVKGEEEFFSSGELIRPLLASAALPPVFSPVNINNSMYGDGGIMNNFPLEPVKGKVDFMIGSNVSVIKQVEKKQISSSFQLATRTTALMIYAINRAKIHQCDLLH